MRGVNCYVRTEENHVYGQRPTLPDISPHTRFRFGVNRPERLVSICWLPRGMLAGGVTPAFLFFGTIFRRRFYSL
jgi:hypothetical protein